MRGGRENWHKNIVKDGRENDKNIAKDCQEIWHRHQRQQSEGCSALQHSPERVEKRTSTRTSRHTREEEPAAQSQRRRENEKPACWKGWPNCSEWKTQKKRKRRNLTRRKKSSRQSLWRALKELEDEHKDGTETDLMDDLKKWVKSRTNKNNQKRSRHGHRKQKKDTGDQKNGNPPLRQRSGERVVEKAKIGPKWAKDDIMDAGEVEMALADGEDPSGRVAVLNMAEAKELRKLAELHSVQKPF